MTAKEKIMRPVRLQQHRALRQLARGVLVAVAVVAAMALPLAPAQADSFTYIFNYFVPDHFAPFTQVGPGGPWGTLTISDPIGVGTERVNITLTITPPNTAGQPLEQFYVNFDRDPTDPLVGNDPDFINNTDRFLVAIGSASGTTSPTLGPVGYADGSSTFGFAGFVFDMNPNPTSGAQTFSGSLALRCNTNITGVCTAGSFIDLNANMFNIVAVQGANGDLPDGVAGFYAAYRTNNSTCTGATGTCPEFWAFAAPAAVPEPASLLLMGSGLVGLGAWARRRRGRLQSPRDS
jgi:hypothetical protein